MHDLFDDFDDIEARLLEGCCLCLEPTTATVRIDGETFAFCSQHEHRAMLLQEGQQHDWPALCYEGITGVYALDNSPQAYVLSALHATDERVVELLDALDNFDPQQTIEVLPVAPKITVFTLNERVLRKTATSIREQGYVWFVPIDTNYRHIRWVSGETSLMVPIASLMTVPEWKAVYSTKIEQQKAG